ncbi:MAG: DUF6340 family protein [Bacteroidales bacterium]|jgi:hypothetical protein
MVKNIVYLILVSLVFTGCSKYGFVKLNYPQPPAAYLPEDVRTIAVVNRSLVKEEDRSAQVIESVASAEVAGSDRLASDECLKGVYDGINGWNGIKIIIPGNTRLYGTGTLETPDLLDWKQVEELCSSANSDVLLVLENFDSNTDLAMAVAADQAISVLQTGTPNPAIPAQVRMNVVSYWRLYDPVTRSVIDQYRQSENITISTEDVIPPMGALREIAYSAGREYIERFLPGYYTVKRDMYKKAKGPNKHLFRTGFRRAEVANWEGAIEIWNGLTEDSKRKTAGRACLNIAVAYEVLGNTDLALQWAKRAYEDYNDKLARDYAKILLKRKTIEE